MTFFSVMGGDLMEISPLSNVFLHLSNVLLCFHLTLVALRLSIFSMPFVLQVDASLDPLSL